MERRILHLSNSRYPSLAGAGPSLAIFQELARGCEGYHIVAPAPRWPRGDHLGSLWLHPLPGRSARAFAVASLFAAPVLARRHRITGVVCQDPLLGGPSAIRVGRRRRVPVLMEVHTDIYFEWLKSRHPGRRLLARIAMNSLRRATLVRTSGPALSATLERVGVRPEQTRLVPYRVDTGFFSPRSQDDSPRRLLTAVSVGRFVPQKGYLELLDALAQIHGRTTQPVRLVLAGGGPLQANLERKIAALELGDAVVLRGWISREEQRDLLAEADVYLQPSIPGYGEWMPRTILEAMAMGLPVLAARVGGIPDVVLSGRNGVLVEPGDRKELAGALLQLLGDAELRRQLGTMALEQARSRYAWNTSFDAYRAVLTELVGLPR